MKENCFLTGEGCSDMLLLLLALVVMMFTLQNTGINSLSIGPLEYSDSDVKLSNAEEFFVTLTPLERSDIVETEWGSKGDDYFNRNYFHSRKSDSYDVSCNTEVSSDCPSRTRHQNLVREYKMEDVVQCLDTLSGKRNRLPIHIAFIGDSTVRQHFISFIQWIPDFDRTIARNSTITAVYAFHEDRNLTSHLMDNLLVSFYWRPFIHEDLITNFKHWASTSKGDPVPDFILLGVTAHPISKAHNILDLEQYENLLENELMPLINQSLTIHPHQEIVWLTQSRTTETFSSGKVYSHFVKKYNEKIHHIFKDTRVVMWDAINALVEEYLRSCALNAFERRDKNWYTNCKDFIHPGFSALFQGTSLIINHICQST
ncbi:Uncharacterized protein APZ42_020092 [Daphnia magna]|uniref:Uncharacterized protein n=1 Tax=Daphnia magna TaxID=35525 RepID=A0A164XZ06_9CRUS|nr:Uncharacterized protein APZ42_020092 [Daphnia magna]